MPMIKELKSKTIIYKFFHFAICFAFFTLFAKAYAENLNATSCSSVHVQEAINSANRGDTVIVPSGTCTWSNEVIITKSIILQGAGIGSTIIKSNLPESSGTYTGYWLFKFIPSNPSLDENVIFEVKNFTLDQNGKNNGAIMVRNTSSASSLKKIKIHNNLFLNCRGGTQAGGDYLNTIMIEGNVYGVIYSNTFYGHPHIDNYGYPPGNGGYTTWNTTKWQPGSEDAMYYEDNVFYKNYDNGRDHTLFSSDKGARYVVRYNTINVSAGKTQVGFDMHGIQIGGTPSSPTWKTHATMGMEAYGNHFINYGDTFPTGQGGGRSMIFGNYITGGGGSTTRHIIEDERSDVFSVIATGHACASVEGYPYPVSACSSDGERQRVTKSYYWNNRQSMNNSNISVTNLQLSEWNGWNGNKLQENVHYFIDNSNCTASSCISGIGCGSFTPTGECRKGVGYWKTNQSCSSIQNGMYGTNPATPLSGTFYRCVSTNNWQAYYTPYIYPHPLRTSDPENPDQISSPKGFRLVN